MDIKALADIAARLRSLKSGNINFDTEIMTAIVGPPRKQFTADGVILHDGRALWMCATPRGPILKDVPDPFTRSLDAAKYLLMPNVQAAVMMFPNGTGCAGVSLPGQAVTMDNHVFGTPEIGLACKAIEALVASIQGEADAAKTNNTVN